ncbi:uncharacterized protein METZ01_LOCUS414902, partial [marine metagenome]
ISLSVDESCQVRHSALEAARQVSNATIRDVAGEEGYALRVHVYPHHILRENKQATGAGADRVSQGMRCSFGKNVGTAARCKRGTTVISISTKPQNFLTAKDALRKASMKIPSPCSTEVVKGREHLKGLV